VHGHRSHAPVVYCGVVCLLIDDLAALRAMTQTFR
jgi:hypothetical protein